MASHRPCPRDASKLKGQLIAPGGCFYVCPTCHGVWLHKAHLEGYLKSPVLSLNLPPGDVAQASDSLLDNSTRCLCDAAPLMKTVEQRGIRIDICPECKAIWLDGGELHRLEESGLTSVHESNIRHYLEELVRKLMDLD